MSSTPERRPNMQQIAAAAGVSKSAVSLALRNDPRLPESTRSRIQAIANKMGYQRNPVVDSLMTQLRAGRQPSFQANLGLINCSPIRDLKHNHTFRRLREGVLRRAADLGYGVEEFWLQQPDMRPERLRQIIEARGIRGLLMIASVSPKTIGQGYEQIWHNFACAVIGVTSLDHKLNCTTNDQYMTARHATEQVLKRGYSRPILVVPAEDDALLEDKFSAGFYSVTRRLKKRDQLETVALKMGDPSTALAAIRELQPDVVITNKSEFYAALRNDGVCIPADMGLVHLDWHDALTEIAGMRQNNRVVGSAGVDLVVGQLQKNEIGAQEFPKVVQIESVWIDGPSVRICR